MANAASDQASANQLLEAAWNRQKAYSANASRYQNRFAFLRSLLAILSVSVVILSVIEGQLEDEHRLLNWTLLSLPIMITALLAFSVKFDRGHNWILLRGNAESLKMEIYYYRTRVGDYQYNRDSVLAKRIKHASEQIKGSAVHQGALAPYETDRLAPPQMGLLVRGGVIVYRAVTYVCTFLWQVLFRFQEAKPTHVKDDKVSDLSDPELYLAYRLDSQFNWYRSKAKELARQLQLLQAGIYLFGALSTLLAATTRFKSWVAVTTALTGALANYIEFKRVEASLVGYNQAADALYDIRAWWYSLSSAERQKPSNFRKLVENCEETIRSEHSSWLQDMQDRLSNLYGTAEDDANEAEGALSITSVVSLETTLEERSLRVAETKISPADGSAEAISSQPQQRQAAPPNRPVGQGHSRPDETDGSE